MNIRFFVSLSGLLLASWLGVTYMVAVPAKHYPLLGKKPAVTTVQVEEPGAEADGGGVALVAGHAR
jgi:hypothetical protein